MSYTKQTWQAGDEITSAKLNHLEDRINNVATEVANFPVDIDNPQDGDTLIYNAAEQKWVSGSNSGGFGGGFLKVGMDMQTMTLDKTWKEIFNALSAGYYVNIIIQGTEQAQQNPVYACQHKYNRDYFVNAYSVQNGGISAGTFITDSENGYPVMGEQGTTPGTN